MNTREVSKDEIIGVWLKREFEGNWEKSVKPFVNRYVPNLTEKKVRAIVDNPNFQNKEENNLRFMLLFLFRSILLLPCWNARWYEKALTEEEFKELRVIHSSEWRLSNPTGELSLVAERVYNEPEKWHFGDSHIKANVSTILDMSNKELDALDTDLILLQSNDSDFTTILEGNKTAVALYIKHYLKKELSHEPFRVFLGHLGTKSIWQW